MKSNTPCSKCSVITFMRALISRAFIKYNSTALQSTLSNNPKGNPIKRSHSRQKNTFRFNSKRLPVHASVNNNY